MERPLFMILVKDHLENHDVNVSTTWALLYLSLHVSASKLWSWKKYQEHSRIPNSF